MGFAKFHLSFDYFEMTFDDWRKPIIIKALLGSWQGNVGLFSFGGSNQRRNKAHLRSAEEKMSRTRQHPRSCPESQGRNTKVDYWKEMEQKGHRGLLQCDKDVRDRLRAHFANIAKSLEGPNQSISFSFWLLIGKAEQVQERGQVKPQTHRFALGFFIVNPNRFFQLIETRTNKENQLSFEEFYPSINQSPSSKDSEF